MKKCIETMKTWLVWIMAMAITRTIMVMVMVVVMAKHLPLSRRVLDQLQPPMDRHHMSIATVQTVATTKATNVEPKTLRGKK